MPESTDEASEKKSTPGRWFIPIVLSFVFVVIPALKKQGVLRRMGDFGIERYTVPEVRKLRDDMLDLLTPLQAAGLCLRDYGENTSLRNAARKLSNQNQATMESLREAVAIAGGMSNAQKGLLDRRTLESAWGFIGQGAAAEHTCAGLADRINAGEFYFEFAER